MTRVAPLTALVMMFPIVARGQSPASGAANRSYFLSANPHVPLAVVHGGAIRSAVSARTRGTACGQPRRWAQVGSEWRVIDTWGQPRGVVRIDAFDDYDVTGCSEVSFAPKPAHEGALLFVSKDSAWRPSAPSAWFPSPIEQRGFETIVAGAVKGHPRTQLPDTCTEVPHEALYFQLQRPNGLIERFAVGGGNGGFVIAAVTSTGWSIRLRKREPVHGIFTQCYRPLSVFDMNGDGVPEVVMRSSEGASWGDFVLELRRSGAWRVVAESPGGATA